MDEYEKKLRQILLNQQHKLNKIYSNASFGIAQALNKKKLQNLLEVRKNFPEFAKALDKALLNYRLEITRFLTGEIRTGWDLADKKVDILVNTYLEGMDVPEGLKESLLDRNNKAFKAFLGGNTNGMRLSDRVWDMSNQVQSQMKLYIGEGLYKGMSASKMATDIKQYLKNPDKRFRRVRDPKTGKLKLSNPAKNYHPGRGVYRSSYKNALRLSRTNTNIAYRTADYERIRKIPFILGIKVKLSGQHPTVDICDYMAGDYPKNFKFSGWHPNCICYTTTILSSREEFIEGMKAWDSSKGSLSDSLIKHSPRSRAKAPRHIPHVADYYIKHNSEKFLNYKSQPYFLEDNFFYNEKTKFYEINPDIGENISVSYSDTFKKKPLIALLNKAVKQQSKIPVNIFKPFKTFREGKQHFKKLIEGIDGGKFKVTNISQNRDLTLVDMNAKMEQLTNLLNDYNISDNMSACNMKVSFQSKGRLIGYVSKAYHRDLSKTWYGEFNIGGSIEMKSQTTPRLLDKSFGSKIDVLLNNKGTVTHEFAHFTTTFHNTLIKGVSSKEINFWKEIKKLRDEYRLEVRKAQGVFSRGGRYGTFPRDEKKLTKIWLGRYASTNVDEFLAEGFKEYKLNSKPSPYAIKIGKIFDKYWKK